MKIKNKKLVIMFLSFFLLYFILGIFISYYFNTANFWSVSFDMDCPRVLGDLSIPGYNHYRISVHPLLVILFQPLVLLLNMIMSNSIISIIFIQSIIATLNMYLIYKIMLKITNDKNRSTALSALFGLSSGQILFSTQIETYIYAQIFLLLMWYFFLVKYDKEYKTLDYGILIVLGVLSLSITITNFVQFLIALFFLFTLRDHNKNKIRETICILFSVLVLSVFLATIQNIIWPSAPNFFVKGINDLLGSSSEEKLYINTSISKENFINLSNIMFSNSFYINKIIYPDGAYFVFDNNTITTSFSIIMSISVIALNAFYIFKRKRKIFFDKFYLAISFSLLFNLCLHLIYGNSIAFLYICHFNFLLLINVVYVAEKIFNIKNLYVYCLIPIIVILMTKDLHEMIQVLFVKFAPIEYFQKIPCLIVSLVLIFICCLVIKKKTLLIIISIITFCISLLSWYSINNNAFENKKDELYVYHLKLNEYKSQLKNMKNEFLVKNFSVKKEKTNIYFFGMADHDKYLYKKGKLLRIDNQKEILNIDVENEIIIPNEYMVIIKDKKGQIHKIYENEKGIYYETNNQINMISEGEKTIKLPSFKGHKYSEILKVLHQEILFNIDDSIPKPNIFGYNSAWYRDSMLGTMVFEKTGNVEILLPWINSVKSIYDYSRSKDIKETDNLGELLYIIGATKADRPDLIKEILIEINNIRTEDNAIAGMVDGVVQKYYPTVLAVYGAKKNNIDLDLKIPEKDDGYAKLTWYYDNKIASNNNIESKYFPYLNWAFYHYSPYTPLYVLDEIYPLSYEADETNSKIIIENECFVSEYYCKEKVYLAHMWHASEMFLFLYDY